MTQYFFFYTVKYSFNLLHEYEVNHIRTFKVEMLHNPTFKSILTNEKKSKNNK